MKFYGDAEWNKIIFFSKQQWKTNQTRNRLNKKNKFKDKSKWLSSLCLGFVAIKWTTAPMIFDIFFWSISAVITIIITQLLLLVFCQLAVYRHTFIIYLYSIIEPRFSLILFLSRRIWKINSRRGRKRARNRKKGGQGSEQELVDEKKRTKLNDISVLLWRWMLSLHHINGKKKNRNYYNFMCSVTKSTKW